MNKNKLIIFIKERREELSISRDNLARMLGYKRPNMITMIENGKAGFPIDRWQIFAKALDVLKHDFLKLVLEEKYPGMLPYLRFVDPEEPDPSKAQ